MNRMITLLVALILAPAVAWAAPAPQKKETKMTYSKPSKEELKKKLTAEQFSVVCNSGTEPPFQNAYWNNHEAGLYVDIASGEPLFSSIDKFDSGTGWPSFTKPIEPENIVEKKDREYGMTRVEVRSKHGDSHLGHVFDDGPRDKGGMRFCINSASLRFISVAKLEAEGYGRYLPLFNKATAAAKEQARKEVLRDAVASPPAKNEVVELAGGCFWGMQHILRKIPGVIRTDVGYAGGAVKNATYRNHEGHAEAVQVEYDPKKLPFEVLLRWYFRMHDPTTLDRQGNDRGSSYRSAIFYHTDAQKKTAEAFIERLNKKGKWGAPVVTEVKKADQYWKAEDDHQDYLVKRPEGYTCHFLRPESVLGD